jgi:hypothetical protein
MFIFNLDLSFLLLSLPLLPGSLIFCFLTSFIVLLFRTVLFCQFCIRLFTIQCWLCASLGLSFKNTLHFFFKQPQALPLDKAIMRFQACHRPRRKQIWYYNFERLLSTGCHSCFAFGRTHCSNTGPETMDKRRKSSTLSSPSHKLEVSGHLQETGWFPGRLRIF